MLRSMPSAGLLVAPGHDGYPSQLSSRILLDIMRDLGQGVGQKLATAYSQRNWASVG